MHFYALGVFAALVVLRVLLGLAGAPSVSDVAGVLAFGVLAALGVFALVGVLASPLGVLVGVLATFLAERGVFCRHINMHSH